MWYIFQIWFQNARARNKKLLLNGGMGSTRSKKNNTHGRYWLQCFVEFLNLKNKFLRLCAGRYLTCL